MQTLYTVTKQDLEQKLANRINQTEAELAALEKVTVNTSHKKLTNRAVEFANITDYLGIGKSLRVSYQVGHHYEYIDIIAYKYDGDIIAGVKQSVALTPVELKEELDKLIDSRKKYLTDLKKDLVRAKDIVNEYNKHAEALNNLLGSCTPTTRGAL